MTRLLSVTLLKNDRDSSLSLSLSLSLFLSLSLSLPLPLWSTPGSIISHTSVGSMPPRSHGVSNDSQRHPWIIQVRGKKTTRVYQWQIFWRRFSPPAYVILTPTLPEPELGIVQSTRELSALTLLVHLPPEEACNRTETCQSAQPTAASSATRTSSLALPASQYIHSFTHA